MSSTKTKQQNSLNAFLKQNPLTPSYTPSAFLKGFVPSVVIESALQTSVSNINPKKLNHSLSPDAKASIEKSMADLSLYRYSLPPDLINTLCTPSQRPETLKIFRTKFNAKKEVEVSNPSGLDDKKTLTKDQIGRDDSIKTVEHLLDRSMKERDRRLKHRGAGSMYINDLWSQGFEKTIMHATKLHKELKEENLRQRRPLAEKLDGIKNLYQRKMRNSISNQGLEDLQSQRPATTQASSPGKSLFGKIDEEKVKEKKQRASMPVAWEASKEESSPTIPRTSTAISPNQRRPLGKRSAVSKREPEEVTTRDVIRTEETPVHNKVKKGLKVQTGKSELNIGLEKCCVTESNDSPETLNTATSPLGGSPMSATTNFMINKQKWDKWRRNTSTSAEPASQVIFGKTSSVSTDKTTSSLLKGQGSLSFSQRIAEMSRDNKGSMNKTQETLVGLLEICDGHLEEKEQYTDYIKGIKRKLKKATKDNAKEVEAQQQQKQRIIEDCIYILNKRDKLRKAF